jgi:VIT1/CCC1 family predicted Fe2+/Mn2+ transporter
MTETLPDPSHLATLIALQCGEITEHHIYTKLAATEKNPHNREVLTRIAGEELGHYGIWKRYTHRDVSPGTPRIWFYYLLARVFGITFAIKLMEGVERQGQSKYTTLAGAFPEVPAILAHEMAHERELIGLIDEDRLRYMGAIVLGLNDALVEFVGMLAGLTFALQNSQIIAVAGLITGVAASLSMGSSEYLSQKSERSSTDPKKSAVYTSIAYIVTVILLVLPFLILASPYYALIFTLLAAVLVIFLFTFYLSVANDLPFWRRFGEMLAISFGIAAISFVIGMVIRTVLNVNI